MSPDPLHPPAEELFAYRDGELTADRRVTVEAHVRSCRTCRETVDEVSRSEALLRSRAADPGEEYFERMTEQVLAKVGAAPALKAAGVIAGAPEPLPLERRRFEAEAAWEEKRARAPGLPWTAIASAVSAVAAVVVVVVLLARQGAFWSGAPSVAVLERSAPDAARYRAGVDTTVPPTPEPEPGPPAARTDGAKVGQAASGPAEGSRQLAKAEAPVTERSGAAVRDEGRGISGLAPSETQAKREQNAAQDLVLSQPERPQANERLSESRAAAPPAGAAAPPAASAPRVGGLSAPKSADADDSGAYAEVRRRYALPPVWGPGVSDELVLRAERALRNLYRTGSLTTAADSARVRLYLAEAARLRAGSAPDSAAVDEIAWHYRRAIGLASGDPLTAGIARSRLDDFLREVGLSP